MSAHDVVLPVILIVTVLILVADHRRGWLTELLFDNLRMFHSSQRGPSRRSESRPRGDTAPVADATGSAGD